MRKRDAKGERIKVTSSITWQRFVNENIRRKIKEVVSDFIEKHKHGWSKVERRDE